MVFLEIHRFDSFLTLVTFFSGGFRSGTDIFVMISPFFLVVLEYCGYYRSQKIQNISDGFQEIHRFDFLTRVFFSGGFRILQLPSEPKYPKHFW